MKVFHNLFMTGKQVLFFPFKSFMIVSRFNAVSNTSQISETEILNHAQYLSEDIGFRTVGTREHALGDAWMLEQALEIKRFCDEAVKVTSERKMECEVDRQVGSGSQR